MLLYTTYVPHIADSRYIVSCASLCTYRYKVRQIEALHFNFPSLVLSLFQLECSVRPTRRSLVQDQLDLRFEDWPAACCRNASAGSRCAWPRWGRSRCTYRRGRRGAGSARSACPTWSRSAPLSSLPRTGTGSTAASRPRPWCCLKCMSRWLSSLRVPIL